MRSRDESLRMAESWRRYGEASRKAADALRRDGDTLGAAELDESATAWYAAAEDLELQAQPAPRPPHITVDGQAVSPAEVVVVLSPGVPVPVVMHHDPIGRSMRGDGTLILRYRRPSKYVPGELDPRD